MDLGLSAIWYRVTVNSITSFSKIVSWLANDVYDDEIYLVEVGQGDICVAISLDNDFSRSFSNLWRALA